MIRRMLDWSRRVRHTSALVPAAELVTQLDVRARELADSLVAGATPSLFKGRGLEPRSVRKYEVGDDTRALDWRVTARRGELHVRDSEEERDLEVLLVVDRSASLIGLETSAPADAVREIAAALAHVGVRAGHRVGLLPFASLPGAYVRPGRGRNQTVLLLRALLEPPSGIGTDLAGALTVARRLLSARGLVVVISDFRVEATAPVDEAFMGLRHRHEVVPIVVHTLQPAAMPSLGPVRVRDPESGRLGWTETGAGEGRLEASRVVDRLSDLRPVLIDPSEPLAPQLRHRFGARPGRAA